MNNLVGTEYLIYYRPINDEDDIRLGWMQYCNYSGLPATFKYKHDALKFAEHQNKMHHDKYLYQVIKVTKSLIY